MIANHFAIILWNPAAEVTGLEPALSALTGPRVNRLHHTSKRKNDYSIRAQSCQIFSPLRSPVSCTNSCMRELNCAGYSSCGVCPQRSNKCKRALGMRLRAANAC